MKRILILLILFFYIGCTGLRVNSNNRFQEDRPLSCETKAKAKSLQFLEQQYRCTSDE